MQMCWGRQGGGVQEDKGTWNMCYSQSAFPERETSVSLNLETILSFQQVINQQALYIFFSILNSVNWQSNLKSLVFSTCSAVNRDWQFIFKHPGLKKKKKPTNHTPPSQHNPPTFEINTYGSMTDYRRAVNAPRQSLGAVTLRDRSFTNTNTVDFLSNVKPPQLFRKWLPRAWNRHCESHVTLPCLLVIEPRGEGAGTATAARHPLPTPCKEQGEPGLPGCWGLLLYAVQWRLCPTCMLVSVSVGLLWTRCCCVSLRGKIWGGRLHGKGVWAACAILGKMRLACSQDTQNASWKTGICWGVTTRWSLWVPVPGENLPVG